MRIGILGTGTMASALAEAWTRRGHRVLIGGRSPNKAQAIANRLGDAAEAIPPAQVAQTSDVVVLAVAWEGLDHILALANADNGSLAGKPVIDCTNAVDYTSGLLKPPTGSAAQHIADQASGGHVVKALHLFAGTSWLTPPSPDRPKRTVAICGDDPAALNATAELIRDLDGVPAVIGGLDHSRQLEEVAGFVMRLVAEGHNPVTAVPFVDRS